MSKIKILLVNLFSPQRYPTIGFPLNIATLAGDLRGCYPEDVEVLTLDMQQGLTVEDVAGLIRNADLDILGFSIKTGDRRIAKEILDQICSKSFFTKKKPEFIVIGGHRPRVFPEEFLEEYDDILVCQSEGEPAMRGLVDILKREKLSLEEVPNLVFKRKGKIIKTKIHGLDLDRYNLPDMEMMKPVIEKGGMVYWESSRGCPWGACTFCNRVFSKGIRVRTIPVNKFIDGLERLCKKGVKHIYFCDEDFLMRDPDRIMSIANGIINRQIKLKFWIQTRGENVYSEKASSEENDKKIKALKMLKKAGLRRVFFGVEAVAPSQVKRYNKGIDIASLARAIDIVRGTGLQLETGFIPIDPMVSLSEIRETVDYIEKNDLAESVVRILNVMCIERGTAYFVKMKKEGLILGERNEETLLYPYKMKYAEVEDIKNIVKEWYIETVPFIYPLRRIVDAGDGGIPEEKFLLKFRQIDFTLLKEMVRFNKSDSFGAEDFEETCQSLLNLGLEERYVNEVIMSLNSTAKKGLKKQERNIFMKLILDVLRFFRNSLMMEFADAIEKGKIRDAEGFLKKGIEEVLNGSKGQDG